MSNAGIARGWNPARGWDTGDLPAGTGFAGGAAPYAGLAYSAMPASSPYTAAAYMPQPVYTMPANAYQAPVNVFPGQGYRYPTAHPAVNPECPGLNLQNSSGGAGCEPGYNYLFPAEHTKIHVIKSREAPWRLPPGMTLQFGAYHVPVLTTLGDLMKGFGATNASAKKNKITEVCQGGGGKWYKGVTFSADEKDDMKKSLKSLGWDKSRTGRQGEKPVIWLWVTKD